MDDFFCDTNIFIIVVDKSMPFESVYYRIEKLMYYQWNY